MYDFEFYYDGQVKTCQTREEALQIYNAGGFYKAVCYFPNEHSACFRIIEAAEDITSLPECS